MVKKIASLLLLLVALFAGLYATSEYLGVNIPIVTDLIDSFQPTDGTAETVDDGDAKQFEYVSTFAASKDGYGFRNYSSSLPEGDMTIDEARAMFGDVVCTRIEDGRCVPHPKVIDWIDNMNETMNDVGHCVGFTVSSNQLYTDINAVTELGADSTFGLKKDVPILRTISQSYASYYASNVWTQEVNDVTPSEFIEALLLLDEPVDIGIFYPKYGRNGHSILGHSVVDQGDGIYHILVYDSNRPGEDNFLVIDTNSDTWLYGNGAVNPDLASIDYKGDAETKSLSFIPISAYNQPLECPADFAELCPNSSETRFSVLTLFGRGQVLAETEDGAIGQSGDNLINTVPDGKLIPVRGELYSRQPPIMLIPANQSFTMQAQGNQENEALKMRVANPSYSIVIDGLVGQPGQIEQVTFDPVTQVASFVAGGVQQPSIQFIFNEGDTVYSTQLIGLTFEAGQDLSVTVDAGNGDLQLSSDTLDVKDVVMIVTQLTVDKEEIFANSGMGVAPGAVQALDLDSWDGSGPIDVLIDNDGDGSYELTVPLVNEPVGTVLPVIGTAKGTLKSLQKMVPYFNDAESGDVANSLLTLGFTGAELGQTYLHLPSLQPTDLSGTIGSLNLPVTEIGAFLFALPLDTAEIEKVMNDIGLSAEEKTAVENVIDERQKVVDSMDEWEFMNSDDPTELQPFLVEQGLTDDQVQQFVEEISLPDDLLNQLADSFGIMTAPMSADGCYWQTLEGDWVNYNEQFGQELTYDQCFAKDSCYGGLGQSGGGCYQWQTNGVATPWE